MAKSESQLFTTVAVRGPGRVHAHVECPITTAECTSAQEISVDALPELRYITHWPWPGHPLPVYDREVATYRLLCRAHLETIFAMHAIAEHTSWASGDGHTTSVSLCCVRMKHVVLGKLWLL